MAAFEVDDDLAEVVWKLAKPKPFEQLTFSSALRRILLAASAVPAQSAITKVDSTPTATGTIVRESLWQKKAPTPDAAMWAASVPELRGKHLGSWKAICDSLRIKVAGDSARRKLRNWVKANRPNWPEVPGIESDA